MDIFEAITKGDLESVDDLLTADPDLVYAVNQNGIRPVLLAVYYGKKEIAGVLRQRMSGINLWEAAALGEVTALREAAAEISGSIDAVASDGFTSLGLAAFFGQTSALEWLLEQEADPNLAAQNPMAVFPIHSAAAVRDPAVALTSVQLLVDYGARVNVAQRGGWTPLHQAADHDHQELVELLLEAGADRSLKSSDGRTPADMAAEKGFDKTAAILS
jgi:ankyrin repeat protein